MSYLSDYNQKKKESSLVIKKKKTEYTCRVF